MSFRFVGLLVIIVVVAAALLGRSAKDGEKAPTLAVSSLLGDGADAGLRVADPLYRPEFPRDHGAHPDFRSEWWYFTGNLQDPRGRPFGFQFTIFRFALSGQSPARRSNWATRQVWMAHLAVTDVAGRRFLRAERFARGGKMALAGATAAPFSAWVGPWSMRSEESGFLPIELSAEAEDFGLRLRLAPGTGPVLQGEDGYSRKGPGVGNASHYYSYTRLPASGEILLGDEVVPVEGDAWLDREWGTSALGPDVHGWDWFSLQLTDGTELMFYQLRRGDGTADPLSAGSVTGPVPRQLDYSDVDLSPRRHWRSPDTGVRYPVAWQLAVPSEGLRLSVEALLDPQEMDLSVNYWEGAVRVVGSRAGVPVEGRGYLEMTGYEAGEVSP